MNVLSLLKYHGLGNDFLVALDGGALDAGAGEFAACAPMVTDDRQDLSAGDDHLALLVRALCDRHAGIGADGVLIVRPGGALADVGMELRNSDGGRAETSGNGLRCFVLATIEAGLVGGPEVVVETDVGARRASLRHREGPSSADVSVEMGRVKVARSDPVADVALPGSTRPSLARVGGGRRQSPLCPPRTQFGRHRARRLSARRWNGVVPAART